MHKSSSSVTNNKCITNTNLMTGQLVFVAINYEHLGCTWSENWKKMQPKPGDKNLKTLLSNDDILWLVCTNCRTRWPDEPLGLPASGPTSAHLQRHRCKQYHIWNASNIMTELQKLFTSQWERHNLRATLWLTITYWQAISDGSSSCFKYNSSSLHMSHTIYDMP